MQLVCFILFFLATIFTSLDAQAGDFEVTPIIGYTFGGDFEDSSSGETLDLAEGENYGVILGLRDKSKAGAFYEFLYSRQSTYIEGNGTAFSGARQFDVDIDYFHLGGRYGPEGERFTPYVAKRLSSRVGLFRILSRCSWKEAWSLSKGFENSS